MVSGIKVLFSKIKIRTKFTEFHHISFNVKENNEITNDIFYLR